ncbi:MAG: hypothetical protein IPM38_19215 [Ignavibacteria bacterium]|nr:hypothetical protein [Ignavibacteria bacterium]
MGKYTIDTLTGSKSPVLTSFKVNYRNPAELAAELDDLWKSDSTAVSGKELKVRFKIYNEGDIDLPGYIANVYMLKNSESLFLKSDTLNNSLLKIILSFMNQNS